jgi:DNA-binding transcriptional ArsR family regulator
MTMNTLSSWRWITVSPKSRPKPIKEFVVISDTKKIKLLLDKTRADIVFKYLVDQEMTVKQLADSMGKKPGTVLHHVQKLNNAGIIQLVRTRETSRGIVERYYRAIAREYRLGITEMMRSSAKKPKTKDPVQDVITGLATVGISIPESEMQRAHRILSQMKEIEQKTERGINRPDNIRFQELPASTRVMVLQKMQQYLLSKSSTYHELLAEWHDLISQSLAGNG